ncbi:hypothetical protein [Parahaliea aestuarii]|uniref:Uncharacterized protein n=1 Tax=Parahaliea aestuarii TaxID=1852021 RepID=A0A5C8ZMH7_9GAMM|nr:hypothetical protein [Parahaliea aestuarii]TXS88964.1 hypothetical protein FVW59_19210 [Parahaliea aestuarii]
MKHLSCQRTLAVYQTLVPPQLAALKGAAWRRIVPGQGGEYFCQLKLQQRYAEMIARQWAVPACGAGYVVRLILPLRALANYDLGSVAYDEHLEYQVPTCELPQLSRSLVGQVELVSVFREHESYSIPHHCEPLVALMGDCHALENQRRPAPA